MRTPHICCANCAIYPQRMKRGGRPIFFIPISPLPGVSRDWVVKTYSEKNDWRCLRMNTSWRFLRTYHRPEERCRYCYSIRLEATASEAKRDGFDGFSTTLLQSAHQDHALIKETGERVAQEVGIPFYYEDFRPGWKKGVEVSKAMGLYRQQYCGCIYSEKERFIRPNKMSNVKVQSSKEI
jgi:predicted adenine nucleotide alpha hydrolase (AANH) superfamily ATPase